MKTNTLLLTLFTGLVFISCKPKYEAEENSPGEMNPERFVMIGGGTTAGYMDNALTAKGQENSLAQLIANQLSLTGGGDFRQPLVSSGSVGIGLQGNSALQLGYKTDCKDVTSLSPVPLTENGDLTIFQDQLYQSGSSFGNYGIPGMLIDKTTLYGYSSENLFYARFASEANATVLGDAVATSPTFFALYLGEEDILYYAKTGGLTGLIPPASFESVYRAVVTALTGTGAKGIVATLPDVTQTPFFRTIPTNGLTLDAPSADLLNSIYSTVGISFQVGANAFVVNDPGVNAFNARKILPDEYLLLSLPLDSVKCYQMGSVFPIKNQHYLSLDEIQNLRDHITAYNSIIREIAAEYGLAVVETGPFYENLQNGFVYNGVTMSSTFVSGGAFSLDGTSLNAKGNALLANEFIKVINAKFGATIPQINAGNYTAVLFP